MTKRRRHPVLFSLLLAVGLCVGGLLFSADLPRTRTLPEHPVPFAEMQYTRPTPDAFNAHLTAFEEATQDPKGAKKAMDSFSALTDELEIVSRAGALASIHNSLDYTDPYYQEELLYCQQLAESLMDRFNLAVQQAFQGPCGEDLRRYFSDEAIESYLSYDALPAEYFDLAAQEQALIQRYYEQYAAYDTLWLDGEERTLLEAYERTWYLPETAPEVVAIQNAVDLRNRELGSLYRELVTLRARMAELLGYDNYSDYAYSEVFYRDYTPADSAAFHRAVKEELVPLYTALGARLELSEVQALLGRPQTAEENLELLARYLPALSPKLSEALDYMQANALYDISPSPTKIDACFTINIPRERVPFLFMQGEGIFNDFSSLVHEFGHFAAMIYASDAYWEYGGFSLELSEVNSQGLEVLFDRFYPEILGDETLANELCAYHLHNLLEAVVTGCLFDEFQIAVYSDPDMSLEEMNALYTRLCEEYGLGDMDFLRLSFDWVLIPHNYVQPLYYISYAASAVPALELLTIANDSPARADKIYMELLYEMDTDDFVVALTDAGLSSPFDAESLARLGNQLRTCIAQLGVDLNANPHISIQEAA